MDNFSAYDVSGGMREYGWQVPAYTFPENREDLVALRVVVRNGYSRDPADMFLDDLKRVLERLEKQPSPDARQIPRGLFPLRIATRLRAPDVHRPAVRPGAKAASRG